MDFVVGSLEAELDWTSLKTVALGKKTKIHEPTLFTTSTMDDVKRIQIAKFYSKTTNLIQKYPNLPLCSLYNSKVGAQRQVKLFLFRPKRN